VNLRSLESIPFITFLKF